MKCIRILFPFMVLFFLLFTSVTFAQEPSGGLIPSDQSIVIPTGPVSLPPGVTLNPTGITPIINVRSGEPIDTSPTPTPEPVCGEAYGEGSERSCCTVDWSTIAGQAELVSEGTDCINILGLDLCLKKVLDSGVSKVRGLIGLNDDDLALIGACKTGTPSTPNDLKSKSCICEPEDKSATVSASMCDRYLSTSKDHDSCFDCFSNKKGYWSGIGCIYLSNFTDFIEKNVFGTLLGFAGVFAFMCILYASILMQTSRGDTEKIKKAQQLLTSCVTGLILIIFSVFILRVIGVDILRIPGF